MWKVSYWSRYTKLHLLVSPQQVGAHARYTKYTRFTILNFAALHLGSRASITYSIFLRFLGYLAGSRGTPFEYTLAGYYTTRYLTAVLHCAWAALWLAEYNPFSTVATPSKKVINSSWQFYDNDITIRDWYRVTDHSRNHLRIGGMYLRIGGMF